MADQSQGFFAKLAQDPAVKGLLSNVGDYAMAKGKDMAQKKMPGPEDASGVIDAGKKQAKRDAAMPAIKGFFKGAWAKLSGKAKGSKGKRPINILETTMIGAPIEMVWAEWLNFEEWPNFMKGPESIKVDEPKEEGGEKTSTWTAKIFWSRRQWKSTITEEVEYERLRWKSEAKKGQVDGVVTFTPAGENLTFVTLVLEYRPKGLFEQTGKLWRSQGRRARLDFKHFQRHVTMADQAEQLRHGEEGDDEQRGSDEPEPEAGASSGTEPAGASEDTGDAGDATEPEERVGEDQAAAQR